MENQIQSKADLPTPRLTPRLAEQDDARELFAAQLRGMAKRGGNGEVIEFVLSVMCDVFSHGHVRQEILDMELHEMP